MEAKENKKGANEKIKIKEGLSKIQGVTNKN